MGHVAIAVTLLSISGNYRASLQVHEGADGLRLETMSFAPMTVLAFCRSYDRDCLDLQDDPVEYTIHLETELREQYPDFVFFDQSGNRIWPVALLKGLFGITGEPLWPGPSAAS